MARGVRELLKADVAVSVTGLAGPDGDKFGHEVGTVFIGYADQNGATAGEYHFAGDREAVRRQTMEEALQIIMKHV
jgi:PncC family amidohydrolase